MGAEDNDTSLHYMVSNHRSAVLNYHLLFIATQTQYKTTIQAQKNTSRLSIAKSHMPPSSEDQLSTMTRKMSSCALPRTFSQTRSSCSRFQQNTQNPSQCCNVTLTIRMSALHSVISMNSATWATRFPPAFLQSSHAMIIFISYNRNWIDLYHMRNTYGK